MESVPIVSLTSYGHRLLNVDLAIRSLMVQTIRPRKIILWLSNDIDEMMLPKRLLDLQPYGLEIVYGCDDLLGHKKYWYAMKRYPESVIVTVDDDLIYPPDLIESLVSTAELYPECVVARRVHRILFDDSGMPLSYENWDMEYEPQEGPHKCLLATTGAGVLYRPEMYGSLLRDWSTISRIAPTADDLWMKAVETVAGIEVAWAPNSQQMPMQIQEAKMRSTLSDSNFIHGGNDEAFIRILDYFGLTADDFKDR
jgi:hypothetical protein